MGLLDLFTLFSSSGDEDKNKNQDIWMRLLGGGLLGGLLGQFSDPLGRESLLRPPTNSIWGALGPIRNSLQLPQTPGAKTLADFGISLFR